MIYILPVVSYIYYLLHYSLYAYHLYAQIQRRGWYQRLRLRVDISLETLGWTRRLRPNLAFRCVLLPRWLCLLVRWFPFPLFISISPSFRVPIPRPRRLSLILPPIFPHLSGNTLNCGDHVPWPSKRFVPRTQIRHFCLSADPQLGELRSANGSVVFKQVLFGSRYLY